MLRLTQRVRTMWPKVAPIKRWPRLRSLSSLTSTDYAKIKARIRPVVPPMAKTMLDDGVLERVHSRRDKRTGTADHRLDVARSIIHSYRTSDSKDEELHELNTSLILLQRYFEIAKSGCERCLFVQRRCVCDVLRPVKSLHDIWLFQHAKEIGRGNNSGSLLCAVAGARRIMRGVKQDEDVLLEHIERRPESTMVMFPTADALSVPQFISQRRRQMIAGDQKGATSAERLAIVMLDGTPGQARNMERFLPDTVVRVKLGMDNVSWLNELRPQTKTDRVCTAQAAALALRDLGDEASFLSIQDAVGHVVRRSDL